MISIPFQTRQYDAWVTANALVDYMEKNPKFAAQMQRLIQPVEHIELSLQIERSQSCQEQNATPSAASG